MKKIAIYISGLLSVALSGCIRNDIPYPVVECRIESIAADGLSGEPVIDAAAGCVTLPLLETTDIQNVNITDAVITEKAVASRAITGIHDLRAPLSVVLSLYDDYPWQIVAEQSITRYFTVEGQVGATEWNLATRTAKVYVGYNGEGMPDKSAGPSSVLIKSLKLGPEGITTMDVPSEGIKDFNESNFYLLSDFTTYRRVYVTCHGRREFWDLYVEYTDMKVNFRRVDGWVRTAWLYGEGLSGTKLGFRYRETGNETWLEVASDDIVVDGGSFRAQVGGLQPETDYEAVAYSGEDESGVVTFRTEPELPLPNADFETWGTVGGLVCPYLSTAEMFWDTGNKGAATVNATLTEGTPDTRPGSPGKTAASLTSKFAGIASLGKFAAGNIFIGNYYATEGTNGRVNFGRPFTSHPTALRGWVKFTNGKIDYKGNHPTLTTDDFDEGMIYIAMGTWTADKYGGTAESPVQVFSKEPNTFFNKNAEDVIGYGELVLDKSIDGWMEFTIPITYKSTDLNPTHIIIVCSASRWGDYFAGSTQNRMWLDDFELLWE